MKVDHILSTLSGVERRLSRLEKAKGLDPASKLDRALRIADSLDQRLNRLTRTQRLRFADADFREEDHPRAANGQFGSGGGGASKSETKDKPKASANSDVGIGVSTVIDGKKVSGEVVDSTADTATIRTSDGKTHTAPWKQVSGGYHRGSDYIPAAQFDAASFAKSHDRQDVTPAQILSHFPSDTEAKMGETIAKLDKIKPTNERYKDAAGNYTPERQALHNKILLEGITAEVMNEDTGKKEKRFFPGILSPEAVERARPKDGEKPRFTILGGRGGSGKSWFTKSGMVDSETNLVLDADHIKSLLPEYDGWNAAEVHEESSDIFEMITEFAHAQGLNLVHDATMKTPEKAVKLAKKFKDSGYTLESHYMHLPRDEAAKRAVGRYLGPTNRLVPPEIVLSNTQNEKAFDEVRKLADKWSFRDNNVQKGRPPRLISESE